MPSSNTLPLLRFAVCLNNADYLASLEIRKLYPVVDDAKPRPKG